MSSPQKTFNRKLVSVSSSKDSDGCDLSIYTYEVEKNGKVSTQIVKTRKTKKFEVKYNAEEHLKTVVNELIKYFNNYKFEMNNQLEEFKVMTRNSEKLKTIVDHIYDVLQIKLTQLQVKQLIATQIFDRIKVKINFE